MRRYKGPLPKSIVEYREVIAGFMTGRDHKPASAIVQCWVRGCRKHYLLSEHIQNKRRTCEDHGHFWFGETLNFSQDQQPYRHKVHGFHLVKYPSVAHRYRVWTYYCSGKDCNAIITHSKIKQHNGMCLKCLSSERQNYLFGVKVSPAIWEMRDSITGIKTSKRSHATRYMSKCTVSGCARNAVTWLPSQVGKKRCQSCMVRHRTKMRPFEWLYMLMKKIAKKGPPRRQVLLSYADFRLFCRSLTCFYCFLDIGRKAYMSTKNATKSLGGYGVDRIDPLKPYTKTNIIPCCSRCNFLKGHTLTPRETRAVAMWRSDGRKAGDKHLRRSDTLVANEILRWQKVLYDPACSKKLPAGLLMDWDIKKVY